MVGESGVIKLSDFTRMSFMWQTSGTIASATSSSSSPAEPEAGSVTPESRSDSTSTDVWALGIMAIQLATGKTPGDRQRRLSKVMTDWPPSLPEGSNFSASFRDFLKSCLQVKPEMQATISQLRQSKFLSQAKSAKHMQNVLDAIKPIVGKHIEPIDRESSPKRDIQFDFLGFEDKRTLSNSSSEEFTQLGRFRFLKKRRESEVPHGKVYVLEKRVEQLRSAAEALELENRECHQQIAELKRLIRSMTGAQ
jgi:serine/threonine protein kinase